MKQEFLNYIVQEKHLSTMQKITKVIFIFHNLHLCFINISLKRPRLKSLHGWFQHEKRHETAGCRLRSRCASWDVRISDVRDAKNQRCLWWRIPLRITYNFSHIWHIYLYICTWHMMMMKWQNYKMVNDTGNAVTTEDDNLIKTFL